MSETDPDAGEATDGLGGFTISLGEFGYISKKYKQKLQHFQDAQAEAEAEEEIAEEEIAVEGEEKEGSANIEPKLPNDYPTAWAKCSISAKGSPNTDEIWLPADQAVRTHIIHMLLVPLPWTTFPYFLVYFVTTPERTHKPHLYSRLADMWAQLFGPLVLIH